MTERTAMLYLSNVAASSIQTELRHPFTAAAQLQAHESILTTIASYALKQGLTRIAEELETLVEYGGELRIYQEELETMDAMMEFWPDDAPDLSFSHLVTLRISKDPL